MSEQTHFGFEQVTPEEKTRRVRGVFDSVATRYDLMNDLMSVGPASRLEALCDRSFAAFAPARACSMSRAAPPISRGCSPRASARRAASC